MSKINKHYKGEKVTYSQKVLDKIKKLYLDNTSIATISKILRKDKKAIAKKLKQMGILAVTGNTRSIEERRNISYNKVINNILRRAEAPK